MSTNLAEQLRKLQAPQAAILNRDKTRPSFLFEPKEIAKYSADQIFELGLDGIEELIKIDGDFVLFKETLFSKSSVSFERTIHSKEENTRLDIIIKKFLLNISPYFRLQCTHKAIEWLVYRFYICEYNIDDIFMSILPYHDTNYFVKFLQILRLKDPNSKWRWLHGVKKNGVKLTKSIIISHTASDLGFLKFLSNMLISMVEEHQDKPDNLDMLFNFYCTVLVGTIQELKSISEPFITQLLPGLLKALSSTMENYLSIAYIIIGQLLTKTKFKQKLMKKFVLKVCGLKNVNFKQEALLVLIIIYQTHFDVLNKKLSTKSCERLVTSQWFLQSIVNSCTDDKVINDISLAPLLFAVVSKCLTITQLQIDVDEYKQFLDQLIDDVQFDDSISYMLIKCCLEKYQLTLTKQEDIEVYNNYDEIQEWYNELLQKLERKYAKMFDLAVTTQLNDSNVAEVNKISLKAILCKHVDQLDGLNNPNEIVRVEALKCLNQKFYTLDIDREHLKMLLRNRFFDTSKIVLIQLLKIKFDILLEIFGEDDLYKLILNVIENSTKFTVSLAALKMYLNFNRADIGYLLNIFHFFLPVVDKYLKIAKMLSHSNLSNKFSIVNEIKTKIEFLDLQSADEFCSIVSEVFFKHPVDLIDLKCLETNQLVTTKVITILFLTNSLTNNNYVKYFNFVESLRQNEKLILAKDYPSCKSDLKSIIRITSNGSFPLQVVLDFYLTIIEKCQLKFDNNNKSSSINDFSMNLFEVILNNCGEKSTLSALCYTNVLKSFLKLTPDPLEFLTNVCILTTNVEFKLRVLKLTEYLSKNNTGGKSKFNLAKLLVILTCAQIQIRLVALNILKTIKQSQFKDFINDFLIYKNEILLDCDQLPDVLASILKKNTRYATTFITYLLELTTNDNNLYLTSTIFKILSKLNNKTIVVKLLEYVNEILNKRAALNNDETDLVNIVLEKAKECGQIWPTLLKCLNSDIMLNDNTPLNAKVVSYVDKDFYEKLSDHCQEKLFETCIELVTKPTNNVIITFVTTFMKRINLNLTYTLRIFNEMRNAYVVDKPERKRKRKLETIEILDLFEWKKGISTLEFLQSKKKLTSCEVIVPLLFQILKKCLDFVEQAALEYAKQLLLSTILNLSNKLDDDLNKTSLFDVELVVQCIRGTQNPQTHHHALLLLAQLAKISPREVLHHTMTIFTFMGSSVLRHDDIYSFQIITKIIETIIPILIEQRNEEIAPILRVFVDVILDIPVHRQLPLYLKLLETLGPEKYLWLFLVLVFESHVLHQGKNITDDGILPKRLEITLNIILEHNASCVLNACVELLEYLKNLPVHLKGLNSGGGLWIVEFKIEKQLRHFKYTLVTFLNTITKHEKFVKEIKSDEEDGEEGGTDYKQYYKNIIINILAYVQQIQKMITTENKKFWKIIQHYSLEVLNNINCLLNDSMFIMVVKGLMSHNILNIRRKSLELVNNRLQSDEIGEIVFDLVPQLMSIIILKNDGGNDNLETFLNQQIALYTLKLMAKLMTDKQNDIFKSVLVQLTEYLKTSDNMNANVLASLLLAVAEIVANLKIHALYHLNEFMPIFVNILQWQKSKDVPDNVSISIITSIFKIIQTLPLFLNNYLKKILNSLSILSIKWSNATLISKIEVSIKKLPTLIPLRILLPSIEHCTNYLMEKSKLDGFSVILRLLTECLNTIDKRDLVELLPDLEKFFLNILSFRLSNASLKLNDFDLINKYETMLVKPLIVLFLKLSETTFRSIFLKIYDFLIRDKDSCITFFVITKEIATSLKSLFTLFVDIFINNIAELLKTFTTDLGGGVFNDMNKNIYLLDHIVNTLYLIFLYDNANFINKLRFDTLMISLVDLLELSFQEERDADFRKRVETTIMPCLVEFASSISDDTLWKQLNYHILLKTRSNLATVRIVALQTVCQIAKRLGDDFLPLLPETVPFLAELMEDENEEIEKICRASVQDLEKTLGESIQKYF